MRKIPLIILAAVLIWAAAVTWGSIGSAVCVFALIELAAALLYQKFLTNRDDDITYE